MIRNERREYFKELRKKNAENRDETDINSLKEVKESVRKDLKKSFDAFNLVNAEKKEFVTKLNALQA